MTIEVGELLPLTATLVDGTGAVYDFGVTLPVIWKSENEEVVVVHEGGFAEGLKEGGPVTVWACDANNCTGKSEIQVVGTENELKVESVGMATPLSSVVPVSSLSPTPVTTQLQCTQPLRIASPRRVQFIGGSIALSTERGDFPNPMTWEAGPDGAFGGLGQISFESGGGTIAAQSTVNALISFQRRPAAGAPLSDLTADLIMKFRSDNGSVEEKTLLITCRAPIPDVEVTVEVIGAARMEHRVASSGGIISPAYLTCDVRPSVAVRGPGVVHVFGLVPNSLTDIATGQLLLSDGSGSGYPSIGDAFPENRALTITGASGVFDASAGGSHVGTAFKMQAPPTIEDAGSVTGARAVRAIRITHEVLLNFGGGTVDQRELAPVDCILADAQEMNISFGLRTWSANISRSGPVGVGPSGEPVYRYTYSCAAGWDLSITGGSGWVRSEAPATASVLDATTFEVLGTSSTDGVLHPLHNALISGDVSVFPLGAGEGSCRTSSPSARTRSHRGRAFAAN